MDLGTLLVTILSQKKAVQLKKDTTNLSTTDLEAQNMFCLFLLQETNSFGFVLGHQKLCTPGRNGRTRGVLFVVDGGNSDAKVFLVCETYVCAECLGWVGWSSRIEVSRYVILEETGVKYPVVSSCSTSFGLMA